MHIFFNMFAVWMFGSAVENVWDREGFWPLPDNRIGRSSCALWYFLLWNATCNGHFQWLYCFSESWKLQALINSEAFQSFLLRKWGTSQFFYSWLYWLTGRQQFSEAENWAWDYMSQFKADTYSMLPVVVGASGLFSDYYLPMECCSRTICCSWCFPRFLSRLNILLSFTALSNCSLNCSDSRDNVAHFAHLGGLITGLILILFWRRSCAETMTIIFKV